jgi:diaminopimelate decarboxylase
VRTVFPFIFLTMHDFKRIDGRLTCEGHDLARIAEAHGTPTYVYSAATMRRNLERLRAGLAPLDVNVCYAMKANSHLAVLRVFGRAGAGFDLVSGGEIQRVIAAGCSGALGRSVFAGVGKSAAEIRLAIESGVYSFHVESEPELERINEIAGRLGRKARIAIRVNPDVDAKTHAKITTGKSENKFGVPLAAAGAAYERALQLPNIIVAGVQMHIGSQILDVKPFVAAAERLVEFTLGLKGRAPLEYVSVGGGVGIIYQDALASGEAAWWASKPEAERPLTPEVYGAALRPLLQKLGLRIFLEPGRFMVGNAGVLLSRVEYVKRGAGRTFVIVDAAMNDLMRPAMYDSYHEILPCVTTPAAEAAAAPVDIVGPVCESGDCFAKNRELPPVAEGDVIALMSAGAYGASMASRYNTRSLPAEVLVDGARVDLITRRETFAQQIANEILPG